MKEGSIEPKFKKQKLIQEISEEKRCLDRLSRLLEMSSQGYTAACFVNNKILISDNEIDSKTQFEEFKQQEDSKIQLIKDVMKYFSLFARRRLLINREKVFSSICLNRIKGEELGYIKLDEKTIKNIALDVLNHRNTWRKEYESKITSYGVEQRRYVAPAYELSTILARDFIRIERFLFEHPNHNLTKAFAGNNLDFVKIGEYGEIPYKSYSLMQDELINEYGYIILAFGHENAHAEGKIVDYLLFTDVIQNAKEPIYIGISKLCCHDCSLALDAVNEYKNNLRTMHKGKKVGVHQEIDYIQRRGTHNLVLPWFKTMFLYNNKELGYAASHRGFYFDNKGDDHPIPFNESIKKFADKWGEENTYVYIDYKAIAKIRSQKSAKTLLESLEKENVKKRKIRDQAPQISRMHQYSLSSIKSSEEEKERAPLRDLTTEQLFKNLFRHYTDLEAHRLISKLYEDLENLQRKRKKGDTEYQAGDNDRNTKGRSQDSDKDAKYNAFNRYKDNSYWYQTEDINAIGNQLIQKIGDNVIFTTALGRGGKELDIKNHLSKFIEKLDSGKKIVGVYNIGNLHWIAFLVMKDNQNRVTVFYKDSAGSKKINDFESDIRKVFQEDIQFKVYEGSEQKDGASCGVFALKNIEVFANTPSHLLSKNSFFNPASSGDYAKDIRKARKELAVHYTLDIYNQNCEILKDQVIRENIINSHKGEAEKLKEIITNNMGDLEAASIAVEIRCSPDNPYKYFYLIRCGIEQISEVKGIIDQIAYDHETSFVNNDEVILKIPFDSLRETELRTLASQADEIQSENIIIEPHVIDNNFIKALKINELPGEKVTKAINEKLGINIPSDFDLKAWLKKKPEIEEFLKAEEYDERRMKEALEEIMKNYENPFLKFFVDSSIIEFKANALKLMRELFDAQYLEDKGLNSTTSKENFLFNEEGDNFKDNQGSPASSFSDRVLSKRQDILHNKRG
ncbi:hypothetical protein NF27_JF00650 [Candidatus Jidaibacter acanthamoeba]|uniref:Ubiquitin-like protease family profile domain-containing protein n=1 Tax=Candidatus Jidaibacter acanthamoebae TaxID=86105 RepID=A0A0C1MQD9_9RICK|nr:hypothetical protein [Candidatus Jidaibacter acanthamoeba]KIE04187.1 hypothetical protein NF27_JF00650 [Candidatus Jidaibacter acanthamoeba]